MNIYRIWQNVNRDYDTYDSAVVAAETAEQAARIHPADSSYSYKEGFGWFYESVVNGTKYPAYCHDWAKTADSIFVEYLGEAKKSTPAGVICASFNAG